MRRRLTRSPFFYGGCFLVTLGVLFFVFLATKGSERLPLSRNVFDESQYLFQAQNAVTVNLNLGIVGGTVLDPSGPPFLVSGKVLGALTGGFEPGQRKEITDYIVESGDTLGSIAEKFNISLETLLWANDLTSRSQLKVGQELTILPVSGVLHIVKDGETVSALANLYKLKAEEIITFNELGEQGEIFTGDILIIPGAKKPKVAAVYAQIPLSQSYFICPVPSPCRISQGLHWFNAVDFSSDKCGEPVFAAAGGTAQRVGFTSLGGNYVRLLHPNGIVTYYGHLSKTTVLAGQRVSQGEVIGYVGYSGRTVPAGPEGCHLHFDVRFAQNPFAK